jgi:VanZ family protein
VDLITNTFGSGVGALIGWPWARWIWPVASIRIRQLLVARPMTACALAVTLSVIGAGLAPAYVKSGRYADIAGSLRTARLVPFGPAPGGLAPREKACLWSAELLAFVLFGGLLALAAEESGRRGVRRIAWAAGVAGALSLAIEAIQVVVPGRDVDLTSVVLAIAGSALGSTAVVRGANAHANASLSARRWIIPAILIWGVAVMLAAWNPARFAWPEPPFWRTSMIVPFWSYFVNRSLEDLADVTGQAAMFLPLGALLAARSWRQSSLPTVLIGFGFGVVLELGQTFLPDRSPDVSDAISAAAGAGLGLVLWRWGESARRSSMGATRYRVGVHARRPV